MSMTCTGSPLRRLHSYSILQRILKMRAKRIRQKRSSELKLVYVVKFFLLLLCLFVEHP